MRLKLAMSVGKNFGWGTCSNYLRRELAKLIEIEDVSRELGAPVKHIPGVVLHTIKSFDFQTELPVWGDKNIGYCFVEHPIPAIGIERAKKFDLILAGSTWNRDLLVNQYGLRNVEALPQGVDTELFQPAPPKIGDRDKFVVFSGGKFEYRKGQDVVLAAFKYLQKKYRDLELVTCWWNPWFHTTDTMGLSNLIKFARPEQDLPWPRFMAGVMQMNGIFPARITHRDMVDHQSLPGIMTATDIGLFPNRCEGGTNLIMMEYMACGLPVIATNATGHMDVLTQENSMNLVMSGPLTIENEGDKDNHIEWVEPSIEEVVACIEWAYENRDKLPAYGKKAADTIRNGFTWEHTAKRLVNLVEEVLVDKPVELQIACRDDFPKLWNDLNFTGNGCEVGVQAGEFSDHIRRIWTGRRLHLVDRWLHEPGQHDIANIDQPAQDELYKRVVCRFLDDRSITVHRMSSEEAARMFSDGYFDWVYLDADHTYPAMKSDLAAWWPKVRIGGMFCGHDFTDGKFTCGEFGVFSAVTEFAKRIGCEIYTTKEPQVGAYTNEDGQFYGQVLRSWYFLKG